MWAIVALCSVPTSRVDGGGRSRGMETTRFAHAGRKRSREPTVNRERAEGNEVAANLSVTSDAFVGALAEHVFGWRATPDRFVKSGRNWIPRWRFNPLKNLDDAFALLDRAGGTYELCFEEDGTFRASVRISNR